MLNHLTIKNIALIDHLDLALEPGLTILTGETGAGKSIILDALGLVLGKRADSTLIRSGADKAMVTACFQLADDHPVQSWLAQKDLEGEESLLIIRRVVGIKTASRAYINEIAVPLATLGALGDQLVEIHGQHDHQLLLNSTTHLALLDAFAKQGDLASQVAGDFKAWQSLQSQLKMVEKQAREAFERRDYLAFQLEEVEQAGIQPGELQELESRRSRLAHANQLAQSTQAALALLGGATEENGGGVSLISQAAGELEGSANLDPTLEPLAETVRSLHYELDDAVERVQHYLESLEINPAQLDEVEERVDLIHRLSRKHHRSADELELLAQQWREELDAIDHADQRIAQLQQAQEKAREAYFIQAKKLTASRKKAGKQLSSTVEKQLAALHMANTRLSIALTPQNGDPRPNGMEEAVFLVSTNPGEPPKPLKQIASGGELSRLMLALKTVLADLIATPTLIFDEVDVGVGGRVAASIGEKLTQVAHGRQVLAITHLPQVAAFGEHHLKVEKKARQGKTQAGIVALSPPDRIEELARMLAGNKVTAPARHNAKALLSAAKTAPNKAS
ncbi:MAG: DNA repair protein RecN [Magnetococcales bacterium]|nr:DNA repair protein RecN [Magnetococcales bacterium]